MRSSFIRGFRHRARRMLPGPTRSPGLVTRLPVRPARFVVGLAEPVRWAEFKGAQCAPLLPAFYLGRVEEVSPEGAVLAVVWERPSGRELSTGLSAREHFPAGKQPRPGDLLRLWTWVELQDREGGSCERVERIQAECEPPRLTEGERRELAGLAEELRQLRSGDSEAEVSQEERRKRAAEWERIHSEMEAPPEEPEESGDLKELEDEA